MKKSLFVLVGLFIAQIVQATSLPLRRDVRLELSVSPIRGSQPVVGGETQTVEVRGNGVVVAKRCRAILHGCRVVGRDFLNAYEMDTIERLIDNARRGRIVTYRGPVCLALPTQTARYQADNGQVFLQSGTRPCGAPTYNDTRAAKRLVEKLDRLYGKLFRHAEIH